MLPGVAKKLKRSVSPDDVHLRSTDNSAALEFVRDRGCDILLYVLSVEQTTQTPARRAKPLPS